MIRPYTRHEFRMWLRLMDPRLGKKNCVAFSAEPKKKPSLWFVNVSPVNVSRSRDHKYHYWEWCKENLQGQLLCYYSNYEDGTEWWGFTNKNDILLWALKWA